MRVQVIFFSNRSLISFRMSFSFAAFESLAESYFANPPPEEAEYQQEAYTPPSPCSILLHLYQQHFSYIDNKTLWPNWSIPQYIPSRPAPRTHVKTTPQNNFVDLEYTGPNKKRKAKDQVVKQQPYIPQKEGCSPEYIATLIQASPGLSEFLVSGEEAEAGSEDEEGEIKCTGIERLVLLVSRGDVELPGDVVEILRVDEEMKRGIVQEVEGWEREKITAGWVKDVDGSWS
jgi:hypothetical protein